MSLLNWSMQSVCPHQDKYSGWDQLPEVFINAEEVLQNVTDGNIKLSLVAGWTVPNGRGTLGQVGSLVATQIERAGPCDLVHGRDSVLATQIERDGPCDLVHGRNEAYLRENRDDSFDSSPRFLSRGPGRGGQWMDPPNVQWRSSRHHSLGYYGSSVRFESLGHLNAAAVAAAKVESSGFVVAPDGTIVKVSSAGPAARGGMRPLMGFGRSGHSTMTWGGSPADGGNMLYRMQIDMGPGRCTNLSPYREIKVERCRPGFGFDAVGPRQGASERYEGGWLIGSSRLNSHCRLMPSLDYQMTRRDRSSLPPSRRRLLPLRGGSPCPRMKSHSRSRTRSPMIWPSPRGRAFSGTEEGSGSRKRSRSPIIRSEVRLERLKSSASHQLGISSRTMSLLPSSGSQCSSSQASKWSGDRRDVEHVSQ